MSKKKVTIEFYSQEGECEYTGRCLGLLTDKEFNAVTNQPTLQKKLMTVATTPIAEIAEVEDVQNLRLAIVTKEKGLFITEPLEIVSQFVPPDDLTLVGKEGSYIMVTEEDDL